MRDKETSPSETLLLSVLYSMEKQTQDGTYFKDEYLANEINVSVSAVKKLLKQLEEKGFIKRETKSDKKHGGKKRVIHVLDKFTRIFDG